LYRNFLFYPSPSPPPSPPFAGERGVFFTFYEIINYDEIVKSKISPPLKGGDDGEGDK